MLSVCACGGGGGIKRRRQWILKGYYYTDDDSPYQVMFSSLICMRYHTHTHAHRFNPTHKSNNLSSIYISSTRYQKELNQKCKIALIKTLKFDQSGLCLFHLFFRLSLLFFSNNHDSFLLNSPTLICDSPSRPIPQYKVKEK